MLGSRERELLANLLLNVKTRSNGTPELHSEVAAVIAEAVGETVAQRAFAVLGSSIVQQVLAQARPSKQTENDVAVVGAGRKGQQSPGGRPHPPGPRPPVKDEPPPGPQPPSGGPQPPSVRRPPVNDEPPPGPQPPSQRLQPSSLHLQSRLEYSQTDLQSAVAVLDRPEMFSAQCVVLDEFLAPQELGELMDYALEHEADFDTSEVISPAAEGGIINYDHRRSRVLVELGKHEGILLQRILRVLPQVADKLGMPKFAVTQAESQITASNDGDFFRNHTDDGDEKIASRHLTFVYFFHREPRHFEGGELRLHDSRLEGARYVSTGTYQTIVPQQNQMVFFPCALLHEITPVECPSQAFADSRFTLNGWLHT
jgi:hypothetical protein